MKKLFLFIAAALVSTGMWAEPVILINQSNGTTNQTDFRGITKSSSGSYTVDGTAFAKYVQLGGAHTTPVRAYQYDKIVQYDAKTNSVEITVWAWNKASSDYKLYISMIEEGTTAATIREFTVGQKAGLKVVETFAPSNNATIYVSVENNSNVFLCQVQADEKGTDLLKGGEVGYSVRLDSCRAGADKKTFTLDGIEYKATDNNTKIWTTDNPIKLKSTNTYVKFTLAQKENVVVNASGKYSITKAAAYNADSLYENAQTIALEAGTWHICPNGSNVTFTSLSFAEYVASNVATLASISVGENALDLTKFAEKEGALQYDYELSMGTTEVPAVTYTKTDDKASVVKVDAADVNGTTTLTVTAEDGTTTQVYKINFSVKAELGTDATLSDVKVGGTTIEGFNAETTLYNYNIGVYASIPAVTYTLNDPNASAVYKAHNTTMVDTIDVTAEDGEATKRYMVTFVRAAATELASISASTTWDWSKAGSATAQWSESTLPKNTDEFNFADVLINPNADFNAAALAGIAQFANRGTYFQGDKVKFNTTVPGKVVVTYSNTGGSRPYRHVKVNETLSAEGSASQDPKDTEAISVAAGDVEITFYIPDATKPQSRDGDVVGPAMGRIYKIVFTKDTPSALDNAEDGVKAQKFVENGQMYIQKDGKIYNVMGMEIR